MGKDIRKPRTHHTTVNFSEPVAPDGVEIDAVTHEIRFWKDGRVLTPEQAVNETTYPRAKGPKVTQRTFADPNSFTLTQPAALLSLDRLYALDTNTKPSPKGLVSLGVVVAGGAHKLDKNQTIVPFDFIGAFEFRGVSETAKPERYAWRALISRITRAVDFSGTWRVGIVVDSDLDALSAINARRQPVCDDFYLPPQIQLLYASADAQRDSATNVMIAASDRMSGAMLNDLVNDRIPDDGLEALDGFPFTHFRFWVRANSPRAKFGAVPRITLTDSFLIPVEIVDEQGTPVSLPR